MLNRIKEALNKSNEAHHKIIARCDELQSVPTPEPRFEASRYNNEREIEDAYMNGKISRIRHNIELERYRANKR